MLEVVRQYAGARLTESGAAAGARDAHLRHFVALAEAAAPHIARDYSLAWVQRLAEDHDNLRAALEWSLRDDGSTNAPRLAGALGWFWIAGGHWREGMAQLERVLAMAAASPTRASRAGALARDAGSFLAFLLGDLPRARTLADEAADAWRALEDDGALALTESHLAYITAEAGELDAARSHAREAERLARAGEPSARAYVLSLGVPRTCELLGDTDAARRCYAEALAVAREQRLPRELLRATLGLAMLMRRHGDLAEAARTLAQAVPVLTTLRDEWFGSRVLLATADVAAAGGALERAARLYGAGVGLLERTGVVTLSRDRPTRAAVEETLRRQLGDDAFAALHADGRALPLAHALGEAEQALRAVGAAAANETPADAPDAPDAADGGDAAQLRVLALGPLEIERAGRRTSAAAWTYAKPREMMLYLLLHPQGRTKGQIALALWPDASPAQVRSYFHVTLHQLRKALGDPTLVRFEHGRYRVDVQRGVTCDATDLETIVTRAIRGDDDALDPLRAALDAYRGDFLEDESAGAWHDEHRDRLRRLWADGMERLAERLLERGDQVDATDVLRRLVARDELRESAHRLLMRSLARAGERHEALRGYGRLERRLAEELDADPAPETAALAARIRDGTRV
jgi:DNA-binding SARP family transcriptional activator